MSRQQALILGKGGRPKKASTILSDTGRIERHIIPLLGTHRVKDLVKADITKALKDIMAGKTRCSVKTKKLRGRAIVRGGAGTATRTIGLFGGILTYAVEAGIIDLNPAHGVRRPKDNVRARRLPMPAIQASRLARLSSERGVRLTPPDASFVGGESGGGIRLSIMATTSRDDLEKALRTVSMLITEPDEMII